MFTETEKLYQDMILRHSRAPLHHHVLSPCDCEADGDNPLCGDHVHVQLRLSPDGMVADCAFTAQGCAISVASADLMAGEVQGIAISETRDLARAVRDLLCDDRDEGGLQNHDSLQCLRGVHEFPSRIKCALLPWAALIAALDGRARATSEGSVG